MLMVAKKLFYCEDIEIFDGFLMILSVLLNKEDTSHEIISQQTFGKTAQQVGSKCYYLNKFTEMKLTFQLLTDFYCC